MINQLLRRHGKLIASALVHESAHCVIGYRLGVTANLIRVDRDGRGWTNFDSLAGLRRFEHGVLSLAGPASEIRGGFSTQHSWLWTQDYTDAAALLGNDRETISNAWAAAHGRVASDWRLICSLAYELGETQNMELRDDALLTTLRRAQFNVGLASGRTKFGELHNGHHGIVRNLVPQAIA